MGMFDKDKEIGRTLVSEFAEHEKFILWGAKVVPGPVTDLGESEKTLLTVSELSAPGEKFEVNTLGSAIASKAKDAEPSDFPAVVKWLQVKSKYGNDATVLQFIDAYGQGRTDSIPPPEQSQGDEDAPPY